MSLEYPEEDSPRTVEQLLSDLELDFDTPVAPPQCLTEYYGMVSAKILKRDDVYFFERGDQRVQLCKSRFRVLASPAILAQIGSKMTHTELLVQRATFQFMLGQEPVVPYIYYIPVNQMTYCETVSQEFLVQIATMMATKICDKDPLQYDPTTLNAAPKKFIDRPDRDECEQISEVDHTLNDLREEIGRLSIDEHRSVSREYRIQALRDHGYYLAYEADVLKYFPPTRNFVQTGSPKRTVPITGAWVQRAAPHVMTPPQVSLQLCDLVMRDGATYVLDSFSGYGSDAAFLQQLPVALEVSDVSEDRLNATIENTFAFGSPSVASIIASKKSFSRSMVDIEETHGNLKTREKILVYVDPPWATLLLSRGTPYDFNLDGGHLSSFLQQMVHVSFVIKVPHSYSAHYLTDIRAVTKEYAYPEYNLRLLYYQRE